MKEERLAILNMLSEGKISVEEAEKLLETVNKGSGKIHIDMDEIANAFSKAGDKVTVISKKVGEKFEDAACEAKPIVKKAAEAVADTVGEAVRAIKKTYEDKKNEKCSGSKPYADFYGDDDFADTDDYDSDGIDEDDFEKDVTIIPVKPAEFTTELSFDAKKDNAMDEDKPSDDGSDEKEQ